MKEILIYHLFTALRDEKRLVTSGTGDYLLLQEYLEHKQQVVPLETFDDFLFVCEKIWLKNKSEQQPFREIFEKWRSEIEKYILNQYKSIEQTRDAGKAAEDKMGIPDDRLVQPTVEEATPETEKSEPGEKPVQSQESGNETAQKNQATASTSQEAEDETEGALSFSIGSEQSTAETTTRSLSPNLPTETVASSKTFLFGNEYFPVANRYLQQNWRNLRCSQELNELMAVNYTKTITGIARKGFFTAFEYDHKKANLVSLFIFIDQGGSMDACEAFGKELAQSAKQSEVHAATIPYYFYNLPEKKAQGDKTDYWLLNENKTATFSASSIFGKTNRKNMVVLVYSDAGAFRGTMDETMSMRVKETTDFLRFLLNRTAHVAWINPAPKDRWNNSAAAVISNAFLEVPMFEATETGIARAINALKGKLVIYH